MDTDVTIFQSPGNAETDSRQPSRSDEAARKQKIILIGIVTGFVILISLIVIGAIYLANPSAPTERIRDIMIIFMALEFMILGLTLVILIIQLAALINLLQNEIKPILDSTNETANTLRGTAIFLSDNLTEPVIKINEYVFALYRLFELIGFKRKKR
jgi:hypothetical protein